MKQIDIYLIEKLKINKDSKVKKGTEEIIDFIEHFIFNGINVSARNTFFIKDIKERLLKAKVKNMYCTTICKQIWGEDCHQENSFLNYLSDDDFNELYNDHRQSLAKDNLYIGGGVYFYFNKRIIYIKIHPNVDNDFNENTYEIIMFNNEKSN